MRAPDVEHDPDRANQYTCLWAARLVQHHIGGHPLGTVGQFYFDAVLAAAARAEP